MSLRTSGAVQRIPTAGNHALIQAFSRHQLRRNLSRRTIEARRSTLRGFTAFYGRDLLSASHKDIERWLDSRPLSPSSRGDYISYLHCFYEWAIREGLTVNDPTVRIAHPKVPKRLPRPIAERQLVKAFMQADVRMLAMLALASYVGLRCMEIANLDVSDIIWGSTVLLVVREGKGGKGRIIPLAVKVQKALLAYGLPEHGPVFPKKDGSHYTPGTISRMINEHLRSCGVSDTAHQLRHRFGTSFYQASKDIMLTKEMMGHSSVATTQGYVAFCPDEAASVVEAL